jgi:hypothetical protein
MIKKVSAKNKIENKDTLYKNSHIIMEKISSELLKTEPSKFWKILVDIFLGTITEMEKNNFQLASSKFAVKEPHLYIKEVPWFKTWYKENKDTYVE